MAISRFTSAHRGLVAPHQRAHLGQRSLDVHGAVRAQGREAGVHLGADAAGARARLRIARPELALGKFSARVSAMASVSHTQKPSSTSTGTRPAGLSFSTDFLKLDPDR